jgi:glycosyltransferase involved in cell wall biosynthesis
MPWRGRVTGCVSLVSLPWGVVESGWGRAVIGYLGAVPYQDLHRLYGATDMCVFASSYETISNILLEGMASGLPIACSDRGPMPEVLGDAGLYFDHEDVGSITSAIRRLIVSPELRSEMAQAAFERMGGYSWRRCADETFGFLAEVAGASRPV